MITVKNSTGKVIVISHRLFQKDIPIDESITLTDAELSGDHHVSFSYFSLKNEQTDVDFGVEVTDFPRKRAYLSFKNESRFPIVSYVNLEGKTELEIQKDDILLCALSFVKQIRLKRLLCKCGNQFLSARYTFACDRDKKRCLKLLRLVLVFTFPIALLLMAGGIYSLFADKTPVAIVALILSAFPVFDLFYFIKMRNWHMKE